MVSYKAFIIPIVSGVLAFFLLIGFTVGYVQYSINQENHNVTTAIQDNNKLMCGIIVTVNESAQGTSNANHSTNSYTLKLREDFEKLDKEYRCGT